MSNSTLYDGIKHLTTQSPDTVFRPHVDIPRLHGSTYSYVGRQGRGGDIDECRQTQWRSTNWDFIKNMRPQKLQQLDVIKSDSKQQVHRGESNPISLRMQELNLSLERVFRTRCVSIPEVR